MNTREAMAIARERGIGRLLTPPRGNAKFSKAAARGWLQYGLSLSAARTSGVADLCPHRSAACVRHCVGKQGFARVFRSSIHAARKRRTLLMLQEPIAFETLLRAEIAAAERRAARAGMRLCVRLNTFSDLPFERTHPGLFSDFKRVQFFDYTKSSRRAYAWSFGELPPNYHLTYSRAETTPRAILAEMLGAGINVAVVFDELPAQWLGYRVIDGDEHDLRFLDPAPCVVGLLPKGSAKRDRTGFVVRGAR